ncbi:MAG: hypothetical protein J6A21_00340 [Lentisphaeria bacterium]|nr:hypothetical protein [Lentisphaeria bacterium]
MRSFFGNRPGVLSMVFAFCFAALSLSHLSGAEKGKKSGTDKAPARDVRSVLNDPAQGSIPPEAETLQIFRRALPSWAANTSCAYTDKAYDGPPAWQLILNRPTGERTVKETNISNGFLLIYMVQARGNVFAEELRNSFKWDLPESEIVLRTVYLGKARGYFWFAKGDLFHLNILHNALPFSGGDNFQKIMAEALNATDFDHFSARTAILYFSNRKDDSPKYILEAMEKWKEEKSDPPYQHLEAIMHCGGEMAGKTLETIAVSRDKGLARKAIDCLLETPDLAEERFLRRLLYLPEYTITVLDIFARRKKLPLLVPDLERIALAPRSIPQFAASVEAHRKITRKLLTVPEINAAAHIRLRMVRLGDTSDSSKFIPLDEKGTSQRTEKAERKRIQPFVELILKSEDREAAVVAALLLASMDQGNERFLTTEYLQRVHKTGVELLQKLPPEYVQVILERLDKSVRDKNSRIHLERIMKELGLRP